MQLTYARVKQLQKTVNRENLLQDLHNYIYQWTETIPTGGNQVDISQVLQETYDQYAKKLANEKAQAAARKENESIDRSLDAGSYDHSDDTDYDAEYDASDTSFEDDDAEYDDDLDY
jgi:hypothetical protein